MRCITRRGLPAPRILELLQYNLALEHKLGKGLAFTGEYVYVHGYEFPLVVDENHIGAALGAAFDATAAAGGAAISAANASLGSPRRPRPGIDCAIAQGATIATYGA